MALVDGHEKGHWQEAKGVRAPNPSWHVHGPLLQASRACSSPLRTKQQVHELTVQPLTPADEVPSCMCVSTTRAVVSTCTRSGITPGRLSSTDTLGRATRTTKEPAVDTVTHTHSSSMVALASGCKQP